MWSPFPSASAVDITDPESVPLSLLHRCSPISSPNLGDGQEPLLLTGHKSEGYGRGKTNTYWVLPMISAFVRLRFVLLLCDVDIMILGFKDYEIILSD